MNKNGEEQDLPSDATCRRGCPVWLAGTLALLFAVTGALTSCATAPSSPAPPVSTAPVTISPQRDWSDAIIYFVLVDRFADGDGANNAHVDRSNPGAWHGGDLAGLRAQLDEIADLGATVIWINPVVKQVDAPLWAQGPPGSEWVRGFADGNEARAAGQGWPGGGFEHWPFHGYWADDFERLEPHFGAETGLKALVEVAHARGIKVLLDVVYNHVGYGSRYLTAPETRDWIRRRETDCAADPVTCQVGGLPDLRTELPQVRAFLFRAHLGLARRVGLDGFRLDTVKHVEHDFWRAHRARTRAELGAGFFLLGEVWGGSNEVLDEWFAGDEMDAGFDFTFKGSCQSFVTGKGRTVAYAAYLAKRHRLRAGYHLAHYLSSHDEPMALHELGNDVARFKLCVALQMTSVGIPVIYYGEEVGRRGGAWPTNRNDMPWGARAVPPGKGVRRDEALRDYYRRLIVLRRAHPALARGGFRALATDGDLLVYAREDAAAKDAVIVAVNRGAQEASGSVPLPGGWKADAVREALSGARAEVREGELSVTVPARTAHVYVVGGATPGASAWRTSAFSM
jgi:alpha-amylase